MTISPRPYTFDRVIRILFTIAIIVAALWLLDKLSNALLPFFVACLLAYIFEPVVAFNKRILHVKNNIIPIALFLIELIGFIALFIYLIAPIIIDELVTVISLIKEYAKSTDSPYLPKEIHTFIREHIDAEYISSLLGKFGGYSAYVSEKHHCHKLDRPSGTAKTLVSVVERNMGSVADVASVRCGEIPGIHTVGFEGLSDRITIEHEAFSREGFAAGAVEAAVMTETVSGVHEFKELIFARS